MEEQRTKDSGNKTRSTQQISVPFLWEEKPGMAKKVWNPRPPPGPLPSRPPPPPPPTFTVSVPFKWEEKPGTPLRTFAPEAAAKNTSLPLPPSYYQFFECFESEDESSFEDDEEEPEWLTELEQDAYSCHVPASTSSSTTSSRHAIGNTSPVGNSFLEQLFPLYAPKANAPQQHSLKGERSTVIRRPHTLGELIMLSRRRTYLHKHLYNRNNSISKELKEPNGLGCCIFGGGIGQVFRGNRLFSLKFA